MNPPGPAGETVRFHPSARAERTLAPLHVERLYALFGAEHPLDDVARALRHYVQGEKPPCVGAMLISCADEAERECRDSFEHHFVRYLLPLMKLSARAEFHVANLGGRYEWGAARVAENHYADAQGAQPWKVMLVKINAHVSVDDEPSGPVFGRGARYENPESVYCGALAALLGGDDRPFALDLAEALRTEEVDRLAALRDPARVDPAHRALFAACASARLQARRAMVDIQDYRPERPTLWLVVPCVTLNRPAKDAEIPLGVYTADRRGADPHDEWCGLGDRPERYRLTVVGGRVSVTDDELARPRRARDHRRLVAERWDDAARAVPVDPAVRRAVDEADAKKHSPYAKTALKAALELALALAPVPAAAVLFGQGLVGIHHANRARRLSTEANTDEAARAMLRDVARRVDDLPADEARHVIQLLHDEYGS
jgi:hypothetical protein